MDRPFRGSAAIACGAVTRGRLAGPAFRRLFPDVYVPADAALDLPNRSRAAYLMVSGRGGVLAGYSAATLLGADCAPLHAPTEVLVPRYLKPAPGLVARYGTPGPGDVTSVDGCLATSAVRTAWDLCRRLPVVEAVAALDSLARAGRFHPDVLLDRRAESPGARGCRRLGTVTAMADPRAESAPETRLRLALRGAGLPAPEVQYEIRDEYGHLLARVDLAYPEARLAVEYDGAEHFTRWGRERDLQRDVRLASYGWLTVRVGRDGLSAAQTAWQVREILASRIPHGEFNPRQAAS